MSIDAINSSNYGYYFVNTSMFESMRSDAYSTPLSESTRAYLIQMGVNVAHIKTEEQAAQILAMYQENIRTESTGLASANEVASQAELLSQATILSVKVGAFSYSNNVLTVLRAIASRLEDMRTYSNAADEDKMSKLGEYQAEYDSLKSRYLNTKKNEIAIYNQHAMNAIVNKYVLGL